MNDAELHDRAGALLLEIRALPPERRDEALRRIAGADERLLAEVESLLAFDAPDAPTATVAERAPDRPVVELHAAPRQIGPYAVLRPIGRGGTGQVFLAEQTEPVRRRVAIKVVPQAALSAELAARFDVEVRALACMEHPNIARVLDTGRTNDGLPYIVMDYIDGVPITEYCRAHDVDLAGRLDLMLMVADAVEHAHQRGVIHRDLKPTNLLVRTLDDRPSPCVLDFGIAKTIPGRFAEESPPTVGLPLGTPAYMAPEQTGVDEVDTRSDVYALGAVLYELVAGRPPIVMDGDLLTSLRRIREEVPTRLDRARADSGASPALGPVSPARFADLACIVGRALEKDPDRRYSSVGGMALDVRRLLRWEPIEARRPTTAYRAARFVRRNRALVGGVAVALVALVVGLVGLAMGLMEAGRQRDDAILQRDTQRAINSFLTDDLLAAASPDRAGPDATALDLLRRAGASVDERFADRPFIAASVHHTLAEAYAELASFDDADRHAARAVELFRLFAGGDAPDLVRAQITQAGLLVHREMYAEADRAYPPLIARARLILGGDDPALYTAQNDYGVVLETLDRAAEAVALMEEALTGRTRLLGPRDHNTIVTMSNLAQGYERAGDVERALTMLTNALRMTESLEDPSRYTLLGLNNNVGALLQDLDRNEEAAPHIRTAATMVQELLGPDHPATLTILGNLAGLEADLGDPLKAMALYEQVAAKRAELYGRDTSATLISEYGIWNAAWMAGQHERAVTGYGELLPRVEAALGDEHWLTAQTRSSLAQTLLDAGRPEEALPHARRAVEHFENLYGDDHFRTLSARRVHDAVLLRIRGAKGSE